MTCCLSCCKYTSFFGIFFYFSIGFIVLFQSQFLKFQPVNKTNTVVACFIVMILEVAILIGIIYYEKKQLQSSVSRPQYLNMVNENRPRESSVKGIDLQNLSGLKRQENIEKES